MVDPSAFGTFNLGDILTRNAQLRNSRQEMQLRQQDMEIKQQQLADQRAERQALGQLFSGGGQGGQHNPQALGALMRVNPQMGFQVQKYFDGLTADQRKLESDKWKAAGPLLVQMGQMPYEARRQFMQSAAPALIANGWRPEEIASFDPTDQNVKALSSAAMTVGQVIDANTVKWNPIGENGSFATDQFGNPVGSGNPFAPGNQAAPQEQPANDAVFGALIQQESGGNGMARSPQGALGSTQMLPGTAQLMAQKLGLSFRPDMLRSNEPQALAYQRQLGQAYFNEGLQKYGGDVEKALMYYHGGPDESRWGPKTRAYAKSVLARTRRAANPNNVRQKAQAAIAAGADPEAVRQRAAALGVTL